MNTMTSILKQTVLTTTFYINGSLVYSFRIENLEAGSFGILIGPETKGRIDYLNIYADELYRDKSKIYLIR